MSSSAGQSQANREVPTAVYTRRIETSYDVSSVTVGGLQVWPFLRTEYNISLSAKRDGFVKDPRMRMGPVQKLRRLRNLLYGFPAWWRSYDYVVLAGAGGRKLLNGQYVHKDTEWLIQALGRNRTLAVEEARLWKGHYPHGCVPEKHVVSRDVLNALAFLPMRPERLSIANESILREINTEFGLKVDYRWSIAVFLRVASVLGRFMRRWQPRAIFLSCYWGLVHQAAIYAARRQGITTCELQHGLMPPRESNHGYTVSCKCDRNCFPEYLMVYGEHFRDQFRDSNFIDNDNVLVTGSGYIDSIRAGYECDPQLRAALDRYDTSVCVASQADHEDEIVAFISAAARQAPRTLFVFVPRLLGRDYSAVGFPENVVVYEHLNFYQVVKFTDFHATLWSSTAVEAPAFGTPNILIDLGGGARRFYGTMLTDPDVTRFVTTPAELVEALRSWHPHPRQDIIARHRRFIAPGHQALLDQALGRVLGERPSGYCSGH